MFEASYYRNAGSRDTQCFICPHNCRIRESHRGICGVRKNIESKLYLEVYGWPVAMHSDPIEKKPLYHFYPGKEVLSLGTYGCNLKCFYCQNFSISQNRKPDNRGKRYYNPEEILNLARSNPNSAGIAYTYNEPVVFFEYMKDIAIPAAEEGMVNVMVTNGFIGSEVLEEVIGFTHAFNVDLKSIRDDFYRKHTGAFISPVLHALQRISRSDSHLEITHLVIPGLNDEEEDFYELISWMEDNLHKNTVLHLSGYHPAYKASMEPTPASTLHRFFEIASSRLPFVYLGNILSDRGKNTVCPSCKSEVIYRNGFSVIRNLTIEGHCSECGYEIIKYPS